MKRAIKNPYLILVIVTGLVSGAAIVFLLTRRLPKRVLPTPAEHPLTAATKASMLLGGQVIGQFVTEHYAGKPVTVVTSPASPGKTLPSLEAAMLTGLQNAVGSVCDLRTLALAPTAESAGALWQPGPVYDQAFAAAADSAVIICLAGLPARVSSLRFWWTENTPPVIIANASVARLEKLVASGKISALLVHRPWHPGASPLTHEQKWLLITPGNVAQIAAEHTSLFTEK